MIQENSRPDDILARLVLKALQFDADRIEIEYKEGCEEVCAVKGEFGFGIASLDSSSEETVQLREQLYAMEKKGKTVTVQGKLYHLKTTIYDSFGEDAFRVTIRKGTI